VIGLVTFSELQYWKIITTAAMTMGKMAM